MPSLLSAAEPLTTLEYRIESAQMAVAPAARAVPKGIAGSVAVTSEIAAPPGSFIEATLRGPSFPGRRIVGEPNEPLLPPQNLVDDYQLDGIRLVDGLIGEVSQQLFELLDAQSGIADNGGHGIGIDGIDAWNHDFHRAFGHEDMLALPVDPEAGFFEGPDRAEMMDAGKLGHSSGLDDFEFAHFASQSGFSVKLQVALDRIFYVIKGVRDRYTLRMTSRQFRTTHRNPLAVLQQRDMELSFHVSTEANDVRPARQLDEMLKKKRNYYGQATDCQN